MTRIVYRKNDKGNIHTSKEVLAKNKVINANIIVSDEGDIHYVVTNLGNGEVLATGPAKTFSHAKKLVKDKFKELGVVLEGEIRKKVEG